MTGTSITSLGCLWDSAPVVILGFALVGVSNGTVLLARAAAADMVPAERRPRQISLVLFGAVAGAVLGPFVFSPLFAGRHLDAHGLVVPWLAAGGFMIVGLVLVLCVRPDPQVIARELAPETPLATKTPLGEILRRPGVGTALLATVASFAVMASVMNLTGYVMVGHGHHQNDVFPVISAHIVGMYGLVLVIGDVIERIGRREALIAGLAVMGVSTRSASSGSPRASPRASRCSGSGSGGACRTSRRRRRSSTSPRRPSAASSSASATSSPG